MKSETYLVNPELESYTEAMSRKPDKLLYDLYRETNLKVLRPRMLTGHLQGLFLEFISKLINPGSILEIGTYTGYGTICLSKGLKPNGIIHTIEINPEVLEYATKYFEKADITDQVIIHSENALDVMPTLKTRFDLVYIDGDKTEYPDYVSGVKPILKTGGIIIIDNVLWDGKVINVTSNDPETQAIHKTNTMIRDDDDFDNFLLPVRDGLMIATKIH
ncbi:MAG: O-methyltransferase [Bacteroidales bacterium]|nr:O-methyltransferase [Bacteroidales bacterium]